MDVKDVALDFAPGKSRPAGRDDPGPPGPPRRGGYDTPVLRLLDRRTRSIIEQYYRGDGTLATVDAPHGAKQAHLMRNELHDGHGLTPDGVQAAREVARWRARATAGRTFDPRAVRGAPLEPEESPADPRSGERGAGIIHWGVVVPGADETATTWWGTGRLIMPGPTPPRYEDAGVRIVRLDRITELVPADATRPSGRQIRMVAVTEHGSERARQQAVWLSDGAPLGWSTIAALAYEHGRPAGWAFTPKPDRRGEYFVWKRDRRDRWVRIGLAGAPSENHVRAAREEAGAIDDWLARTLEQYENTSGPQAREE